jgi:hypothetical protein
MGCDGSAAVGLAGDVVIPLDLAGDSLGPVALLLELASHAASAVVIATMQHIVVRVRLLTRTGTDLARR